MQTTPETLRAALTPICHTVATLDLAQPAAAEAKLAASVSPEAIAEVGAMLGAAFDAGWLCPKGGPEVFFGRLAKPSDATSGVSIDAVEMEGEALEHAHPKGEVSLCFARSGAPRFDGRAPGFVVLPPGSRHVPTVTGGRMLIVYFLPDGAMDWGRAPA
jgi:hypothetical protein